MDLDAGGPRPRIPSIGYAEKSSETLEASPKGRDTEIPAMLTVSVAVSPDTDPVPYVKSNSSEYTSIDVESDAPKVL